MKKQLCASIAASFFALVLPATGAFAQTAPGQPSAAPSKAEACMAKSKKTLEKCHAECAKDMDKQTRCDRNCEAASDKRDKACNKS